MSCSGNRQTHNDAGLFNHGILAIHAILVEKYGDTKGVRGSGAAEAACSRLQCGDYGDIIEKASVLMESLLITHPFLDGNKRTTFAACDVLLRINGRRFFAAGSLML